jgi:hypothetical protein
MIKSKNSTVAKNGLRAESVICVQENVSSALGLHFNKDVAKILRIAGWKKSDILIEFKDGSSCPIQNKDGNGGGRGWSVDRRALSDHPFAVQNLLTRVCLKKGGDRDVIGADLSRKIIEMCLLGPDETYKPKYFIHTVSDKASGKIISMSICETGVFMEKLFSELYEKMVPKRTCVHLSPSIYLQRKGGGGPKEHKPDHIQMKFRLTEGLQKLFVPLF